jgi:hypothetical protein
MWRGLRRSEVWDEGKPMDRTLIHWHGGVPCPCGVNVVRFLSVFWHFFLYVSIEAFSEFFCDLLGFRS